MPAKRSPLRREHGESNYIYSMAILDGVFAQQPLAAKAKLLKHSHGGFITCEDLTLEAIAVEMPKE